MIKFGGMLPPRRKNTAGGAPEAIPLPLEVKLPMSMHCGTPANPVVKTGDLVKVGQVIGEAAGAVSLPVHASVSGTVKSIDTIDTLTGERTVAVTITSDGSQTLWEGIAPPPQITDCAAFLKAVKNSGLVEPGGCPAVCELTLENFNTLDYILVNGLESEPYVSSGAMADQAEYVWEGVRLLKAYLNPRKLIICIGKNKPQDVKKMKALSSAFIDVEVCALSPEYPQGHKNVLVHTVTGQVVPEGGRPADIGCIVISCATVAAIAEYVKTGKPLVSMSVTVDGSAVKEPKYLIAPIGTPVSALFDYCGGLKDDVKKITLGGPMTGAAIPSANIPIVKTTSAVLAFSGKTAAPPEALGCIKCGRCVKSCPMRLLPPYIENAFELKKTEQLRKYKADMCAVCGCCTYVCPSKRPLTQVMTLAKSIVEKMSEKKEAE